MPESNGTALEFYCGVCAKRLTDGCALFTSCGHFFCATPNSKCTRLAGKGQGRCEQCGRQCDVGNLANRGSNYDSRVQSFVFSDLFQELQNISEIVKFRVKHLHILGENAAAQQQRIITLTAECKQQMVENEELRRDNEALREELKKHTIAKETLRPARVSNRALARHTEGSDEITVVDVDNPVSAMDVRRNSIRGENQAGIQTVRPTEPSGRIAAPNVRNLEQGVRKRNAERVKKTTSHATGYRSFAAHDALGASNFGRTAKRTWADRGQNADSGRYASSKLGRGTGASRFGYAKGERTTAAVPQGRSQGVFGGDWQRKVSSVPRPSATPDRMRRVRRRSNMGVTPMGSRY